MKTRFINPHPDIKTALEPIGFNLGFQQQGPKLATIIDRFVQSSAFRRAPCVNCPAESRAALSQIKAVPRTAHACAVSGDRAALTPPPPSERLSPSSARLSLRTRASAGTWSPRLSRPSFTCWPRSARRCNWPPPTTGHSIENNTLLAVFGLQVLDPLQKLNCSISGQPSWIEAASAFKHGDDLLVGRR